MSKKFQEYLATKPEHAAMSELVIHAGIKALLKKCKTDWTHNKILFDWAKLVVSKAVQEKQGKDVSAMDAPIQEKKKELRKQLGASETDVIETHVTSVLAAVINHQFKGIGYVVDKTLGTDQHVSTTQNRE
jgi:hypothetical protein